MAPSLYTTILSYYPLDTFEESFNTLPPNVQSDIVDKNKILWIEKELQNKLTPILKRLKTETRTNSKS